MQDENIKRFTGALLVSAAPFFLDVKYKIITDIRDYETGYPCIVVENLDPDYYLLFGSIGLIITGQGGVLSHLAILAREYNIPIIRIENITSEIPQKGILSIKGQKVEVKTSKS